MNARIYSLLDPRNNKVFYIGATISDLGARLMGHCSKISYRTGRGVWEAKYKLIRSIIKGGLKPDIELISEVDVRLADHCEKFYYLFFKNQ